MPKVSLKISGGYFEIPGNFLRSPKKIFLDISGDYERHIRVTISKNLSLRNMRFIYIKLEYNHIFGMKKIEYNTF